MSLSFRIGLEGMILPFLHLETIAPLENGDMLSIVQGEVWFIMNPKQSRVIFSFGVCSSIRRTYCYLVRPLR